MGKLFRVRFPLPLAVMALFLTVNQVRAYNDSLVTCDTIEIGSGPFHFDFAALADPHVGCWKKQIDGKDDFGTQGWNDYDNDPSEKPYPIHGDSCCVAFIRDSLIGRPDCDARFVVVLGDIAHNSERSELERARKIFAPLDSIRPLVPLLGNHDGWPYVGGENNYIEQDRDSVCIGEYFVDAFRGVYDSLRYIKLVPNWQQDYYLLTSTDQTCEDWPSYYENFGFSYQGCRFIAADFISRIHAPSWPIRWPGLMPDPDTYYYEFYKWTLDWLKSQVEDVREGERMVCLGHNPYVRRQWNGFDGNFTPDELHQISTYCGVRANEPIATSIGGHWHDDSSGYWVDGGDTMCNFFSVAAAKNGHVYLFCVKDSVQLQVTHSNPGPALSCDVYFTADFASQGDTNEASYYYWDFGDGACPSVS